MGSWVVVRDRAANRFCHIDWAFEPRTVIDGFVAGWSTPPPPGLPATWTSGIPLARGWVDVFLTVRSALTLAVPTDLAAAGRAWPSRGSWDMAAGSGCPPLALVNSWTLRQIVAGAPYPSPSPHRICNR